MSVLEFDSYVDYILMKIQIHNKKRGYQSVLARAAKCQTSYFSSVLQHKVFLTPDQASALCDFWHLSENESEYFLALVSYARSGTNSLKKRIEKRLVQLRQQGRDPGIVRTSQTGICRELSAEDKAFFHQSWLCAAVYGAVRIRICKTTEDISSYLNISKDVLTVFLNRLQKMGLMQQESGRWIAFENVVFSDDFADFTSFHNSLQDRSRFKNIINVGKNLRYSFVGTCSLKGFEEMKNITRTAIHSQIALLDSGEAEETLVGVCYDLFLL